MSSATSCRATAQPTHSPFLESHQLSRHAFRTRAICCPSTTCPPRKICAGQTWVGIRAPQSGQQIVALESTLTVSPILVVPYQAAEKDEGSTDFQSKAFHCPLRVTMQQDYANVSPFRHDDQYPSHGSCKLYPIFCQLARDCLPDALGLTLCRSLRGTSKLYVQGTVTSRLTILPGSLDGLQSSLLFRAGSPRLQPKKLQLRHRLTYKSEWQHCRLVSVRYFSCELIIVITICLRCSWRGRTLAATASPDARHHL